MTQLGDGAQPSAFSTMELLLALGFIPDEDENTASRPRCVRLDFSNGWLVARRVLNRRFLPCVLLSGMVVTRMGFAEIDDELDVEFASFDEGVALVTWVLDKAMGGAFVPKRPVAWLAEGRRNRHLLPWERERAAYEARPHCIAQRKWARLALRALAEQIATEEDDSPVAVAFDGAVLTLRCGERVYPMPAYGKAWAQAFEISVARLRRLPKRLMRDPVEISIWDSALGIGRWRFPGVKAIEVEAD